MLTPRMLAQLSDVFERDAMVAVDPTHDPDASHFRKPVRKLTLADWAEQERLIECCVRLRLRAMAGGWDRRENPFLSEEELEETRVAEWDEVF